MINYYRQATSRTSSPQRSIRLASGAGFAPRMSRSIEANWQRLQTANAGLPGPDPRRSARLAAVRYRIETVHGQLSDRYRVKRTRQRTCGTCAAA